MNKIYTFINQCNKGKGKGSNNSATRRKYEKFIQEHRQDWQYDLLAEIRCGLQYSNSSRPTPYVKYRRFVLNRDSDDEVIDEKTEESDSDESFEYNKCVLSDDEGIPSEDEDIDKEFDTAGGYVVK